MATGIRFASKVNLTLTVGLGALLVALAAAPASALDGAEASPFEAVWESKISLRAPEDVAARTPVALCSARLTEGSSRLALLCRHELGTAGAVSLVRDGSPFALWSAPLASPFEAVAELTEEALAALHAGELAIRIDTGAAGGLVEGPVDVPVFDSDFETFSLCEWSNYPCPSDGNVCTDEVCSATGQCSHPTNGGTCPIPNGTGGCFGTNCSVFISCNSGYSNCDNNVPNGCELVHNTNSGSCAGATFVGEHGGDLFCDGGCLGTFQESFANRTGKGEAWYEARALENSSCDANVRNYVYLEVPEGVDFDLYVYRNCVEVGKSTGISGVDETVEVVEVESVGSDDSFNYQVEVRYFSGHSCEDWSLTFVGQTCD